MSKLLDKKIIDNSRVMVVGCGTLGNEVLKNLALLGVGEIVIVDFDNVEEINLNTSTLFCMAEKPLGRPKVEVAEEVLKKLNPAVRIITINGDFIYDVGQAMINNMDVVISCVDNRLTRFIINRYCMAGGVTWIDGGISELEGSVKTFTPGKGCYACLIGEKQQAELQLRFSCAGLIRRSVREKHAPTNSLIASVIGAIEVQEALKIILNKKTEGKDKLETLEGKILSYDGLHNSFIISKFEAWDEGCVEHDSLPEMEDCGLTGEMSIREAIDKANRYLNATDASIILLKQPFVSNVVDINTDMVYPVMKAASKTEEFISGNSELSGKLLSDFRQTEWTDIDKDFMWQELKLSDLGILSEDIILISTTEKEHFFLVK